MMDILSGVTPLIVDVRQTGSGPGSRCSPDTARAKTFYGELFGWTFSEAGPDYSLVGLGDDAPIGGGIAPLIEGQAQMAIICVQVADVAETCGRVEELGGHVLTPAQTMDDGLTFAYVADPDFGVLGVRTPPPAA
jgi:hypothetical protein